MIDSDLAANTHKRIQVLSALAYDISDEEIAGLRAGISRIDTVLPITDPTAYRDLLSNSNVDANRELVETFSAFRSALNRIAERYPSMFDDNEVH